MSSKSVFLIQVGLKYPPEHCVREILALRGALGGNAKPATNGKYMVGFVTSSHGTVFDLVKRLAHVLEVDAFENYWITVPARPVAAKHGGIDALPSRVGMAYAALDARPSKHLAKSQVFVKQKFRKGAAGQVLIEGAGVRQPPQQSDSPYAERSHHYSSELEEQFAASTLRVECDNSNRLLRQAEPARLVEGRACFEVIPWFMGISLHPGLRLLPH